MKKMFSNVLLATAILMGGSALLSSCSDKGDGPDPEPTPDNQTAKYSECTYFGEQKSKTGRYELMLSTSAVDSEGKPTEAGYQYIIQLYTTVAADPDNAVPTAGTYLYDAKNSFAVNTVSADGTKAWKITESGNKSAVNFTDLTVVIEGQGVAMTVKATFTLSDGKKVTVTGKDFVFSSEVSNQLFTKDVDISGGSQAVCIYTGDYELTEGGSDPFAVYQLQFLNGAQNLLLNLELYGPKAGKLATAAIPTGNLSVVEIPSPTPSVGMGWMDNTGVGGSYCATMTAEGLNFPAGLVESGSVNITKSGENYSIKVDCVSSNGYKITGSFSGAIPLKSNGQSNLEGDLVIDIFGDTGKSVFIGVQSETGLWQIMSPSTNTPGDESLNMAFFTESTTYAEEFPIGTYKAATAEGQANTFMPGYINDKQQIGPTCWTRASEEIGYVDQWALLVDGTITVSKDADGKYTFTFDTYDDLGNHVTGSWTAALTFEQNKQSMKLGAMKMNTLEYNLPTSSMFKASSNRFQRVN